MISIKKYNNKLQKDWDNFVKRSKYGTLFQTQKFLSYHITKKFIDFSLLFYKKNVIVAVLPAAIIKNKNTYSIISHPGASYGGFIFLKSDFLLYKRVILAFESLCKEKKFYHCKIIPTPVYYENENENMAEYVLSLHNYVLSERYISHVIYLKSNNPISYFNQRKQRYLKNRLINNKSYTFKKIDNLQCFYSMLVKNKRKFNTSPTHSLEEIKNILKLYPKSCKLTGTYYNNQLIGGTMVFITTTTTGLLFYNVVSEEKKHANLGTFQVYQCINFCLQKKLLILDLGVSHLPNNKNPLEPKLSLIQFKEQCGGVGVMRNVFEKNNNNYAKK